MEIVMAPEDLTKEEAALWDEIVATEPPDCFNELIKPLLAQYCRHISAARHIADLIKECKTEIEKLAPETMADPSFIKSTEFKVLNRLLKTQERESRAIASLATKLRITQQATINKRGNKTERKPPWLF
jgi:3-methyladenine DNA glycosylase/8-oxoguanine DNA glycosylase